jgi:hypothetical protein
MSKPTDERFTVIVSYQAIRERDGAKTVEVPAFIQRDCSLRFVKVSQADLLALMQKWGKE